MRILPEPLWDGRPLAGKTIFLHREQGLGDTIQFIRYVPSSNGGRNGDRGMSETVAALLASVPGVDQLFGLGDGCRNSITHAPLLSLTEIFRTALDTIPAAGPYLFASPALIHVGGRSSDIFPAIESGSIGRGIPTAATGAPATCPCSNSPRWRRFRAFN